MNGEVGTTIVDDPYEYGAKIKATYSFRDDPIGRLRAREQIDDAQFAAGRKYQQLCETAEIVALKAMDTTKEPVDGGGSVPDPYNDRKHKAAMRLNQLSKVLGMEGESLCRDVLERHMFFGEIAAIRCAEVRYIGMRFRECLETLAIEFNFAPPKRPVG